MMNAINDHRQPYWHPSWIEPDPHYRQVRIDHTRRALRSAPSWVRRTSPPSRAGRSRPGSRGSRPSTCSSRCSSRWPSTPTTCGVLLLIEPEPGLLLETTDQYLEVAERLNAPSIGLNFDVGHAYCVSEDLPRAIAKLAPHIRHYHLEDIAATRVHHHLVPGTGRSTSPRSSRPSAQTGYDGWLTVELYPFQDDPDAAARQALEVLRPLVQPARAS